MIPILFSLIILLNAVAFPLHENNARSRDTGLKECMVKGEEEIADDEFVTLMFNAFKEETLTEDPSIEDTGKQLKDINGHKLLGALVFYIDAAFHAAVRGKNKTKMLDKLTEVTGKYHSDGPSLASSQLWPYRCYNAETTEAFKVYLSDILPQIVTSIRNGDNDLAMFLRSLLMNLQQLNGYVGEMIEPAMSLMCSLIEESKNRESIVRKIIKVFETLSTETGVVEVACSSPYNDKTFCLLPKTITSLQLFLMDYKKAGSSAVMKSFALMWFFEPNLSHFCGDSATKCKTKIQATFASSEVNELRAIVMHPSKQNYQKIRLFISQHVLNHFSSYLVDDTVAMRSFKWESPSSSNKHSPFYKHEYPIDKPTDDFLKCFQVFLTTLLQMDEAIVSDSSTTKIRALAQLALLWFMHPDFGAKTSDLLKDFLEGLHYFINEVSVLKNFGLALGECGSSICRTNTVSSIASSSFCEINEILQDVKVFASALSFSPKTKVLTPLTTDYRRMLSEEGLWSIQSKVERIFKTKKLRRRAFISMQSEVTELLTKAASLALSEAKENARVLLRMIENFLQRIREVNLEGKLSELIRGVLQASASHLTEMAEPLAGAVVNALNPFRWLMDVPGIQEVLDRFSEADQVSGNVVQQLEQVFGDAFRMLHGKALEVSKAEEKRSEFHRKVKKLFDNITKNNVALKNTIKNESKGVKDPKVEEKRLKSHKKEKKLLNNVIENKVELKRAVVDESKAVKETTIDKSKVEERKSTFDGKVKKLTVEDKSKRGVKDIKVEETNSKSHRKVKNLFDNLTENKVEFKNNVVDESGVKDTTIEDELLSENIKSDYYLSNEDIKEYTALVNELIEKLCGIFYKGKTLSPLRPEEIEAAKAKCLNIRKEARATGTIHEEILDFQFEFMETILRINQAVRIKRQADEIEGILRYERDKTSEGGSFSQKLKQRIIEYRITVQAKMLIHQGLSGICDEIEYKNGGVQSEDCITAMLTLSRGDTMKILSGLNLDECPRDQTRNLNVRIPASLNPNQELLEKGYIDLTSIYEGKVTLFEIPFSKNLPWFQRFASGEVPSSPDVAMYIKRLEVFLPDMSDPLQPIEHDLRITVEHGNFAKVIPSGYIKYAFADPKRLDLRYSENKQQCIMGYKESPYPTLCEQPSPICVERRGELSMNETALPLYSRWLIRASIPKGLTVPRPYPGTAFYLRAVMSICVNNPKNINLGSSVTPPNSIDSLSGNCCREGGFWNIDRYLPSVQFCLQCPAGSTPMLGGLYCHDTSQNTRDKKKRHKNVL